MVYRTIRQDYVHVLGEIWQPGVGPCGLEIKLRDYDLQNIIAEQITGDVPTTDENLRERFTRDSVEQWLAANSGDFQNVIDFYATAGDVEIPWQSEENELAFSDAMYGAEE